jgi:hypothetical protein
LIGHFSHPVQSGHDSNPVLPVMSNEVEEEADPPESFTLQPTNISEPFISDKHSGKKKQKDKALFQDPI